MDPLRDVDGIAQGIDESEVLQRRGHVADGRRGPENARRARSAPMVGPRGCDARPHHPRTAHAGAPRAVSAGARPAGPRGRAPRLRTRQEILSQAPHRAWRPQALRPRSRPLLRTRRGASRLSLASGSLRGYSLAFPAQLRWQRSFASAGVNTRRCRAGKGPHASCSQSPPVASRAAGPLGRRPRRPAAAPRSSPTCRSSSSPGCR